MGLSRLPQLRTLKGYRGTKMPRVTPPAREKPARQENVLTPTPQGWQSLENYIGHTFVSKIDLQWLPQYKLNGVDVDEFHPMRRIALFFDGSYFHSGAKEGYDLTRRAGLRSQGYQIVAWKFESEQEFRDNLTKWYNRDIS